MTKKNKDRCMKIAGLSFLFAVLLMTSNSYAQDFYSARTLATGGAFRALATGSDALFLNPAGMSQSRTFNLDAGFQYGGYSDSLLYNVVAIDSETSWPLAAGIGWTHMTENEKLRDINGYRLDFGISYPIADFAFIGTTARYFRFDVGEDTNHWSNVTVDLGSLFIISRYVAISAGAVNLIQAAEDSPPLRSSVGIRIGDPNFFSLLVDNEQDYTTQDKMKMVYHAGGELVMGGFFALRGGYSDDTALSQQYMTLGAGLLSPKFALEFGFKQRMGSDAPSDDRLYAIDLRIFLL